MSAGRSSRVLQPQRHTRFGHTLPYLVWRGSAMARARGNAGIDRKRGINAIINPRVDGFQIIQNRGDAWVVGGPNTGEQEDEEMEDEGEE